MNPRRRYPYQISDSHFRAVAVYGRWVVREHWTQLDRYGQKDDIDVDRADFETEAEAQADADRRNAECAG